MSELSRTGAAIDLERLSKSYGLATAVEGVDLSIRAGEFMTFLGPSGSGKTTTLNMIAGFVPPTTGDVRVDGQSVVNLPTHKREMGMVFQGYALFPHMSVADNIAFPLRQRRVAKEERVALVEAALRTVRLAGMAERRPAELSGGQQQRVALARAMIYRPAVLLMDEPLGALDKKLRESLQEEIRAIHREVGTTFVYVTHDQEEALSLSDRIAVYNEGRLEQVGKGEELYERPSTRFVAQFLGESTLIGGTIGSASTDVVDLAGQRVQANNHKRLTGSVAIMVRPERLRLIARDRSDELGQSRVAVKVLEEVYLGHSRKLSIGLPDGTVGTVRESPEHRSAVSPGEDAYITWQREHAVLLPDDRQAEGSHPEPPLV